MNIVHSIVGEFFVEKVEKGEKERTSHCCDSFVSLVFILFFTTFKKNV
jgi:hypothetical protein